jgi:hypothetical protein
MGNGVDFLIPSDYVSPICEVLVQCVATERINLQHRILTTLFSCVRPTASAGVFGDCFRFCEHDLILEDSKETVDWKNDNGSGIIGPGAGSPQLSFVPARPGGITDWDVDAADSHVVAAVSIDRFAIFIGADQFLEPVPQSVSFSAGWSGC